MSELQRLIDRCLSVSIEINEHRVCHQSIEEFVREQAERVKSSDGVDPAALAEMKRRDATVVIQCYYKNSVGFVLIDGHYDLDAAVAEAHEFLDRCEGGRPPGVSA